jgi:hypothetical protein
MRNRVFLHMGAHKTGTTSLQAALAQNRSTLLAAGLVYPAFNNADAHHHWARVLAAEQKHISPAQHKQITSDWLKALKPEQALLLSAESFYRYINTQPDYVCKLKEVFSNTEIIPVLCLRRQADYAKSLYGEWVMNWQYPHDIYTFTKAFYRWFNFEHVVKLVSQLGKPVLISYHQIAGKALSSNFLIQIGCNAQLEATGEPLRVSVSDAEVYLKRQLNKVYPQTKLRTIVTEIIKHFVWVKYKELARPMPALIWHGALQPATFERSYKLSNLRLVEQFGLDPLAFFPLEQTEVLTPVNTSTLSLLTHVYNEVHRAVLYEIRLKGAIY